jgi:hypothetical protein
MLSVPHSFAGTACFTLHKVLHQGWLTQYEQHVQLSSQQKLQQHLDLYQGQHETLQEATDSAAAAAAAAAVGVFCPVFCLGKGSMGGHPMSVYSAPADYGHMGQQQQQEEPADDNTVRELETIHIQGFSRSALLKV